MPASSFFLLSLSRSFFLSLSLPPLLFPPSPLPSSSRQNPEMCRHLADSVERTMEHAIVKEEKIPLEQVTNLEEVCQGTIDRGWIWVCPGRAGNGF